MSPFEHAVAFGTAAATALVVCAAAWAVSRGRVHGTDRVGAAAVAVGFVVAYQGVTGGGWDPERPVTWLPLVAVAGALLGPRLAGRVVAGAVVPAAARIFVLVAAAGAAAAMLAGGRAEAAALELAVLGAALGIVAGGRFAAHEEAGGGAGASGGSEGGATRGEKGGERAPGDGRVAPGPGDGRVGAWVLAALLVGLVPVVAA